MQARRSHLLVRGQIAFDPTADAVEAGRAPLTTPK
jgi:hypothetical protein